jgi:hypothetical protein
MASCRIRGSGGSRNSISCRAGQSRFPSLRVALTNAPGGAVTL